MKITAKLEPEESCKAHTRRDHLTNNHGEIEIERLVRLLLLLWLLWMLLLLLLLWRLFLSWLLGLLLLLLLCTIAVLFAAFVVALVVVHFRFEAMQSLQNVNLNDEKKCTENGYGSKNVIKAASLFSRKHKVDARL